MAEREQAPVTELLQQWRQGDPRAPARLAASIYPVLRDLARAQARRNGRSLTLGSTELAHEAYERLCQQRGVDWQNRGHFFAICATVIRRVAVDYMRRRLAEKRGGDVQFVTLGALSGEVQGSRDELVDLLALDQALVRLEAADPDAARLVEMRLFAGLTIEDAAGVTGLSTATLGRKWRFARAWLAEQLQDAVPTQAAVDDAGR